MSHSQGGELDPHGADGNGSYRTFSPCRPSRLLELRRQPYRRPRLRTRSKFVSSSRELTTCLPVWNGSAARVAQLHFVRPVLHSYLQGRAGGVALVPARL